MAEIVNPKVSIVVPISNYVEYLSECLKSIVTQTYENIEIVCVNNCTNPEARITVSEYAQKDARIIYKEVANAIPAKLKNVGMSTVSGMFMMFVSPTDSIEVDMVAGILRTAAKCVADVTMCAIWEHDIETKNRVQVENEYYTLTWLLEDLKVDCFPFSAVKSKLLSFPTMCWGKLYNVEFLRTVGACFPETLFYEDELFFMNLIYNAGKISIDRRQLYNHKVNIKAPMEFGYDKHYADILEVMEEIERILKLFAFYEEIKNDFFVYRISRIMKAFASADQKVEKNFYNKIQRNLLNIDMVYSNEALIEKAGCADLYNVIRNESYYKYKYLSTLKKILAKMSKK